MTNCSLKIISGMAKVGMIKDRAKETNEKEIDLVSSYRRPKSFFQKC